jgi:hypothetical protein
MLDHHPTSLEEKNNTKLRPFEPTDVKDVENNYSTSSSGRAIQKATICGSQQCKYIP